MSGDGINENHSAQRQINAEGHDISNVIDASMSSTPLPVFQIAVVVDVIYDPQILTEEDKKKLRGTEEEPGVSNSELVDRMTRKSIIARIISRGIDHSDNRPMIFLPGFPAYDHMPIKPGEQVFVFFADPGRSQRYGFWMWRVPEPLCTEDINYTHGDRRYDLNLERSTAERAQGPDDEVPGFPNGSDEVDGFTLQEEGDYETIVKEAKASVVHTNEPVPRFSPRPGDRVLQGSNNARVVLGQDRARAAQDPPRAFSGTIDLVVGVGTTEKTAPLAVQNARGALETDKTPKKRNEKDNIAEGDPDFANDASRIYVSMNTNADENFEITDVPGGPSEGGKPAIVLKTDQLRFVVREDFKIMVENGASLVFKANGDIIMIPNDQGILKLGGEDADKAILVHSVAGVGGGKVLGNVVLSTMGGQLGIGSDTGTFASKILVK